MGHMKQEKKKFLSGRYGVKKNAHNLFDTKSWMTVAIIQSKY